MTAFVDSNVLIDVLAPSSPWRDWSSQRLLEWSERGPLLINDLIYAEVSVGFEHQTSLDEILSEMGLNHMPMDREALFAAGKAFQAYRQNEGVKLAILPDFMIGAHAMILNIPLITRDLRRFRTYFPTLILITPGDESAYQ